jgi:hypothetical protein
MKGGEGTTAPPSLSQPTPSEPSPSPSVPPEISKAAPAFSAIWRYRPIFITSTFQDLHAERDHLRRVVFPALEERLQARHHHLVPIDLRWAVETRDLAQEHDKELLILKVCLAEIKRSRPFLIGLLGDRYGWLPPPERIRAAAQEMGFQTTAEGKSVTALEIEYGVLADPDQRHRSRFYFREPLPYDRMDPPHAARYSDAYSSDTGAPAALERLKALKRKIKEVFKGETERVRTYQAG